MLKRIAASAGIIVVLGVLLAPAVLASVPKVVLFEDFTAQWCQYCPSANCGLEQLQGQLGYDHMVYVEDHVSNNDIMATSETIARGTWYGVNGIPDVRVDGNNAVIGGGDCNSTYTAYLQAYNQRMNATAGVAPVNITGSFVVGPSNVTMTGVFSLVDPATLTNTRATLLLYEDNVQWCCGFGGQSVWNKVTRKIYDQNITLTNVGDQVTVTTNVPLNPNWDPTQLHVVAYLQQTSGDKHVIQTYFVPLPFSFSVALPVRSVPSGNGTAAFTAVLTNASNQSDTYTIAPGTAFGAWPSTFYVCGDNNPHTAPVQVSLPPNGTCTVTIDVSTDATKGTQTGTYSATSANSGLTQSASMKVFNESYSVLLVANDGNHAGQQPIVDALNTLGYLHDDFVVSGPYPTYRDEAGYDVLIWETSRGTSILGSTQMADLQNYMDAGGALFLTSQYFLNSLNGQPNTFVTNYLGVASWTLDKGYGELFGVSGDVIGDGLDLPLNFQYPSFKKGDDAVPGPTATTDLLANDGSHSMIRNTMNDGSRSVFLAEDFDAISATNPDPNNTKTVVQRVLSWLQPNHTANVVDPATAAVSRLVSVRPNPFGARTEISFSVSTAASSAPVRLEIFDAAGRKVSSLFEGRLTPGAHAQTWSGLSDQGRPAGSGIYLARLTTSEGAYTDKLILVK